MEIPQICLMNALQRRGAAAPGQWGRARLGGEPEERQRQAAEATVGDRDTGIRGGKGAVWPSAQLPSCCHRPARLLHLLSHTQFPGHAKSSSLTACSSKHPGLLPPGRPFSSCKLLFLSQDPRKTLHMSKTSSFPRPPATAPSLIRPLCTQSSLLTLLPSLPLPTRLPNPTWSL